MKTPLAIVGPTAVGKTKLSISLAQQLDGEIINCDAMQVYKGLDIGTAKIKQEEMQGIPHHLIDIIEADDIFSVALFQQLVRKTILDIQKRGKWPILVGGTGLYLKAVFYDYVFKEQQWVDMNVYEAMDNDALHHYLSSIDKISANLIHPNNRKRVLRTIEVYEATGQTKSEQLKMQTHQLIYPVHFIGLKDNRDSLYARIDQRVDIMVDNGLEAEAYKLFKQSQKWWTSTQAIGYKEFFMFFEGRIEKGEAIELIKKKSRNYAKRQMTWFNNQLDVDWYDIASMTEKDIIEHILKKLEVS